MAVRHVYTHLCEFALVDNQNRFSYINVISKIVLDEIPGALISLFIGVAFTGAEGQAAKISVEDPKKKELFQALEQTVPNSPEGAVSGGMKPTSHALIVLKPAVFQLEGTYNVVLRVGGKVIHREPFAVLKRKTPEGSDKNVGSN
jgi:hypothetical protein